MNKALKAIGLIVVVAALSSAVAQDELTPEQQAQKCADQGGCGIFTRDAIMYMLRDQFTRGYSQGVQSCARSI